MNKKKVVLIGFAASLLLTGGCASTNDVKTLQRQILMVNQKLEQTRNTTMEQLQKRQAGVSNHLDQLEKDITQLRAQIEESYYLNQRLREQNKELEAAIINVAEQESVKREEALHSLIAEQQVKEAKIQEMLKRQEENVKAIQAARVRELERKAKEAELEAKMAQQQKTAQNLSSNERSKAIYATQRKVRRTHIEDSEINTAQAPPSQQQTVTAKTVQKAPVVVKQIPSSEETKTTQVQEKAPAPPTPRMVDDRMERGKRLLQQGKHQEALSIFEEVAQDNVSPDQIAAQFMTGESLFALKQYDLAVVKYQTVFAKSPESAMAPQALMRQAEAFEKMADKDTAKLVYAKVIKHYGSSPQAAEAKNKLSSL